MHSLTFIGGIFVGAFLGALLWDLLVAGPSHRRLQKRQTRLYARLTTWQEMAIIAWNERDRTHHALDEIYGSNTGHSTKVTEIKAVK